jgi:hypothetical protein
MNPLGMLLLLAAQQASYQQGHNATLETLDGVGPESCATC